MVRTLAAKRPKSLASRPVDGARPDAHHQAERVAQHMSPASHDPLSGVEAERIPGAGACPDARAVDDGRRGALLTPLRITAWATERLRDARPGSVVAPRPKMAMDGAAGGKVAPQHAPLTPGPEAVDDRIAPRRRHVLRGRPPGVARGESGAISARSRSVMAPEHAPPRRAWSLPVAAIRTIRSSAASCREWRSSRPTNVIQPPAGPSRTGSRQAPRRSAGGVTPVTDGQCRVGYTQGVFSLSPTAARHGRAPNRSAPFFLARRPPAQRPMRSTRLSPSRTRRTVPSSMAAMRQPSTLSPAVTRTNSPEGRRSSARRLRCDP